MKEMVGGCCVCSDERGWTENPLVYCDGSGCTVAVHQACYGIVTVPTGPWYCRKCESQERAARVQRCELCPSKDGALKRTDNSGWAHVVCALYIPEVRFGNVTTMEPILLQHVPNERFNKNCYICEEQGRGGRATVGACMQCNKSGCRQQFHVTCAQALGLLCEEAGNYLDNVKYCGYCQHHYSKLKGGNVKTIPPYKPIPPENASPESSPEKFNPSLHHHSQPPQQHHLPPSSSSSSTSSSSSSHHHTSLDSGRPPKRKGSKGSSSVYATPTIGVQGSNSSTTGSSLPGTGSTSTTPVSSGVRSSVSKAPGSHPASTGGSTETSPTVDSLGGGGDSSAKAATQVTSASATPTSTRDNPSAKFTTSNFTETVVTQSESIFGAVAAAAAAIGVSSAAPAVDSQQIRAKKRRGGGAHTPTGSIPSDSEPSSSSTMSGITAGTPTAESGTTEGIAMAVVASEPQEAERKYPKIEGGSVVGASLADQSGATGSGASTMANVAGSHVGVIAGPGPEVVYSSGTVSAVVSTPTVAQSTRAPPTVVVASSGTPSSLSPSGLLASAGTSSEDRNGASIDPGKKSRAPSAEKPLDKGRTKTKRSGGSSGNSGSKRGKSSGISSSNGGDSTHTVGARPISEIPKGSPPSSPTSESQNSMSALNSLASATTAALSQTFGSQQSSQLVVGVGKKGKKKREEKDIKLFQNGVSAPHMLGNQLNPASTMAQRMSDTLSAELEAHSIFNDANQPQLVGPQLHSRVIASARANNTSGNPNATTPPSQGTGSTGGTSTPQSLDQLLERQWEQGSQFLMEQAQHFDIASLLTCLHQLRAENLRLEEHVNSLVQRRDHLLAVNARLAIPLPPIHPNHQQGTPPASSQGQVNQQQQGHQHHHQSHHHHHHHMHPNNVNPQVNNLHLTSGATSGPPDRVGRMMGSGGHSQSQPMENGLPPVGVEQSPGVGHHVSSGVLHDPSSMPQQHHQSHSHRGQGVVVVGVSGPGGQQQPLMAPSGHRSHGPVSGGGSGGYQGPQQQHQSPSPHGLPTSASPSMGGVSSSSSLPPSRGPPMQHSSQDSSLLRSVDHRRQVVGSGGGGNSQIGQYPAYQVVSPPAISSSSSSSSSSMGGSVGNPHQQVVQQQMPVATQVPVVTTQQMVMRRESEGHHQMTASKPS
ncbi:protein AF-10-like isoform X3 [Hetaerina americana]|uniref:protein AF-10-like isoform X3 n=1 Tax=Hetaerina americana TaxID=62018 RepID=UPI003A7F14E7